MQAGEGLRAPLAPLSPPHLYKPLVRLSGAPLRMTNRQQHGQVDEVGVARLVLCIIESSRIWDPLPRQPVQPRLLPTDGIGWTEKTVSDVYPVGGSPTLAPTSSLVPMGAWAGQPPPVPLDLGIGSGNFSLCQGGKSTVRHMPATCAIEPLPEKGFLTASVVRCQRLSERPHSEGYSAANIPTTGGETRRFFAVARPLYRGVRCLSLCCAVRVGCVLPAFA